MTSTKPKRKYRPKETLGDMSEDMASLLVHCATQGAHPKDFGSREEVKDRDTKARWTHRTRNALEEHRLIHLVHSRKGKALWRATENGRTVVSAHAPRLLMPAARPRRVDSEGSCYTHIHAFAMRHEPEAA